MSALTGIVAEDEPVLRAKLRSTLATLWPDLVICAEAEDGVEALRALNEHSPAVLFLDIEMPGLSGLEVAKQASGKCHVVFVTAYDSYAVAAFEQGAVDYVMKPFSAARLATAVSRLREKVRGVPANLDGLLSALGEATTHRKKYLRWLTVSERDDLRLITVDEICYFRADNKYTVVVTPQQESLVRRSLKDLLDELDPRIFLQIHRGTLVNANAIAGVTRDFHGRFWVKFKQRKEKLPVSEPYVHLFNRM
jgi:DNA-binding LytR/AlgR family response regulator